MPAPVSGLRMKGSSGRSARLWFIIAICAACLAALAALCSYCNRMEQIPWVVAFDPVVSPDGRWVAYVTSDVTMKGQDHMTHRWALWRYDRATGTRRRLDGGEEFRGDSGKPEIYELLGWDAHGKWLCVMYSFDVYGYKWVVEFYDGIGNRRTITSQGTTVFPAMRVRDEPWLIGANEWYRPNSRLETLWLFRPNRKPENLYKGPPKHALIEILALSADGKLAIVAAQHIMTGVVHLSQVYVFDMASRVLKQIPLRSSGSVECVFEPDGKHFIFADKQSKRVYRLRTADLQQSEITPTGIGEEWHILAIDPGPIVYINPCDENELPCSQIASFGLSRVLRVWGWNGWRYSRFQSVIWGRRSGYVYDKADDQNHPERTHVYWSDLSGSQVVRIDPPGERERYEASWLCKAYRTFRSRSRQ